MIIFIVLAVVVLLILGVVVYFLLREKLPKDASIEDFQREWRAAGCNGVGNINAETVAWWRTRESWDDVRRDMRVYAQLASNCSGQPWQNNFCMPGKCK